MTKKSENIKATDTYSKKDESVTFRKEWRIYGYTGKGNVRVPKDHETGKRNDRGSGTVYGSYRDIGFLCGRRHCRFRL